MIRLETILTPGRSLVNAPGGSKKKALEQIANLISKQVPELEMQDVYEALIARENSARPVLVTASPFLTAASKAARHLSAPCCTWTLPSISTPSTVPRSTCCSCCWSRKPPPMHTWNCSGRSPACSTARKYATNCAVPAAMRRCIRLSWLNKTSSNHAFDHRQWPLRLR